MKKESFLLRAAMMLLLVMFFPLWGTVGQLWADHVTAEQARQQAQDFLNSRIATGSGPRHAPGITPQLMQERLVSGLYVFNVSNDGGFVIVSNDDRTVPVLGFGDSGNINPDNMPDNMRAWLQGYADEIAWLNEHTFVKPLPAKAPRRTSAAPKAPIGQLLTTEWNQGTPYNNLCPYYQTGKRSVTGCVATAMAQAMYYTETKAGNTSTSITEDIPAYTSSSYNLSLAKIAEGTVINWGNMIDSYAYGAGTNDQKNAVAQLMLYCGCSVEMDYGPSSGSNTDKVVYALKQYFDYNTNTTQYVSRSYYTYDNWIDLIYHELYQGRPVIYGGQSSGGGHEFVCDGYYSQNGIDFFHINWGWGGTSDDYFVLSALDPDEQGIGGSSSTDGFHYGQDAVIGIQKSDDSGSVLDVHISTIDLEMNGVTVSNDRRVGQEVTVTIDLKNNSDDAYDGDIYMRVFYKQDGNWVNWGDFCNNFFIPANSPSTTFEMSFTPDRTGTYCVQMFYPAETPNRIYSIGGMQPSFLVVDSYMPTDLTVSGIDATSAVLSWAGRSDSYKVQYRTPGSDAVVFFDDFENGLEQWTTYKEGEGPGWLYTNPQNAFNFSAHSGSNVACAFSWNGDAYNADNWLVTPQLNLRGTLKFWVRTNPGYPDQYEVRLSTSGNAISDFTVTLQAMNDASGDWTEVSLDLSQYAGRLGYIAIHHVSYDMNYLFVDDFGIYSVAVPAGDWNIVNTDETSVTITGLTPNTTYECQVFGFVNNMIDEGTPLTIFTTLELEAIALSDNATDNSSIIEVSDGKTICVTLTGRTLYKDGYWNTLCLPFNVDLMAEDCPLAGATAKTLTNAQIKGTTVSLTFGDAVDELVAGVPYIIKWEEGIALTENELVFSDVTISNQDNCTISLADGQVKFIGYYDAFEINTPADDNLYYMTGQNTLKHTGKPRTLKACRAYFKFSEEAVSGSRRIVLNFGDETTDINELPALNSQLSAPNSPWYTVDGRRLEGAPTKKGLYINGNKKRIVK